MLFHDVPSNTHENAIFRAIWIKFANASHKNENDLGLELVCRKKWCYRNKIIILRKTRGKLAIIIAFGKKSDIFFSCANFWIMAILDYRDAYHTFYLG